MTPHHHEKFPQPVLRGMNDTAVERFWAKVKKGPECWLWTGALNSGGYGNFYAGHRDDGRYMFVRAHRFSWALANGPLPAGGLVLHICDTPACVNPDHLMTGGHSENVRQAIERGRWLPPGTKGERVSTAKLTREMVRQIRHVHSSGRKNCVELAQIFGVGETTIHHVVHVTTWKHVA